MRIRVFLLLVVIASSFLLLLSSCGSGTTSGTPAPPNSHNGLDVYGINVRVHSVPEVYIKQPLMISAVISSLYPLSDLFGVFASGTHKQQEGTLSELLQPPASGESKASGKGKSSGKGKPFAMCMDISLQLDDPSAFALDEKSASTTQEFPIVPDVTKTQVVTWNLVPLDTYGRESVDDEMSVDVAFTAKNACDPIQASLLKDDYHLVSSSHNTIMPAKATIVNPELRQEREVVEGWKKMAEIALPLLLVGDLAWISGHIQRLIDALRKKQKKQRPMLNRILGIGGFLLIIGGFSFIFLASPIITNVYISAGVILVGLALSVIGGRRSKD